MHATTNRKKSDKSSFKFTINVKERGIHVQTIIMMSARSGRIEDKRYKIKMRDDRRIGGFAL